MPATSREVSLDPRFIGIPWKEGGCSFSGCDCYGLVRLWYRKHRNVDIGYHGYGIDDTVERAPIEWKEIERGEEEEGDVIVCEEANGNLHCLLVVTKGTVLHIPRGRSSLLERYDWTRWKPKARLFRAVFT